MNRSSLGSRVLRENREHSGSEGKKRHGSMKIHPTSKKQARSSVVAAQGME